MTNAERPRPVPLFSRYHAEAAAMLGRAFVDDPLFKAMVPPTRDPEVRVRRMGVLFEVVPRLHRGDGQRVVGVIADGRVASAAVIEHAVAPPSTAAALWHSVPILPALVKAVGWSGLARAITVFDTLAKNRPPAPHLYLNILGVEPALQRRHYGVTLRDYLRDQAAMHPDFAGVYLETAAEANVGYYSRIGYQVLGEIHPLGVRMWRMLAAAPELTRTRLL